MDESTMLIRWTGEVVPLSDVTACARALTDLREAETEIRQMKATLTALIVEECGRRGVKTLHLEGVTAEIAGGSSTVYDAEVIEQELREAGMPEDRIREIVEETVSYRVRAVEAKRAAGMNPTYRGIMERNSRTEEKPWTVRVK